MTFAVALLALAGLAQPAAAEPMALWEPAIAEASARFGVPASWIRRVILAESAGSTTLAGRPIRSRAGAMGLMQLMPRTWTAMRRAHGLGPDPHNPRDNILAGTAYLRAMYERFGYPGLFAAYNAGPGRYAEHLARGTGLPAETVAYLAQVVGGRAPAARDRTVRPRGSPAAAPEAAAIFVGRADIAGEGALPHPGSSARGALFYPLAADSRR